MSIQVPHQEVPAGLPDPAALAKLAGEFFGGFASTSIQATPQGLATPTLPPGEHGVAPAPLLGAQAPVQWAPAGSPLASPAGFAPAVPGTPVPQGLAPGVNLIPSPAAVPSLANRAPALRPHAVASNGVPDLSLSTVPAYEPRIGGLVQGVPEATPAVAETVAGAPAALPFASSASPQYYFVDAVTLRDGYVTPEMLGPYGKEEQAKSGNESWKAYKTPADSSQGRTGLDVHAVRRDFPILQERVNGRQIVWFDNAATTQKPQVVIDRLAYFYAHENSNIHRAAHELAARATDAYEGARETVRRFLNAGSTEEIIFVRGTTEAINFVAKSWGARNIGPGDEIIVSHLEHHANIVPWQQLASEKGAKIRVIPVDDDGQILLSEYQKLLNDKTKIVSVTQVSNALGTVTPIKEIVALAHRAGAKALVDGAQSVSHLKVDVQALDADFFVFSGHKIFGPTGIGVVYGKRAILEDTPPWQGGGNMIADVTFERTLFQPPPAKFEAGTGNIADAVGLGAALEYVERIGIENIGAYEHALLEYATLHLKPIPGVRIVGTAREKASVLSFVLDGYTTDEVGKALNAEGIAVRTGHHCAQPILRRYGLESTVRPSFAFYNTCEEVDRFIAVIRRLSATRPKLSKATP